MADEAETAAPAAANAAAAVRKTGIVLRSPGRRWIEVSGQDAASHLQAMSTQELDGLAAGEARFAALADDRGRYLADFWVIRVGEDWRLDAAAGLAGDLVRRLNMFAVSADAELRDLDETHALYHLEGPLVATVLGSLIGVGIAESAAGRVTWRGASIEYCRRSHFGEPGYTLLMPRPLGTEFETAFSPLCAEHGLVEAPAADVHVLRVQAGRPLAGVDMGSEDLLPETGLGAAISLTKGCYPGQEILQRIARQGKLRKRLTGLRVTGIGAGEPLADTALKTPAGEELGRITSDAASGADRLALGWMVEKHSAIGAIHRIVIGGDEYDVEVVALPFVSGTLGPLAEVPRSLEG